MKENGSEMGAAGGIFSFQISQVRKSSVGTVRYENGNKGRQKSEVETKSIIILLFISKYSK